MFNLETTIFKFLDVSIYCVSSDRNISMIKQFFLIHQNQIDLNAFVNRIELLSIYSRFVPQNMSSFLQFYKYNYILKSNGLLINLKYFDEILFISEPHTIIKKLNLHDLYGKTFKISKYWKDRFSHLPNEFIIYQAESSKSR